MLRKVFGICSIVAVIGAIFCGNGEKISSAVLEGASGAVTVSLSLCGIMCFWGGVMRVLEEAGAVRGLSKILRPILKRIFPDASEKEDGGLAEISACVGANLLGIGNAATPLALRAMEKLQKNNPQPDRASGEEITLAVMNTASLTLIPSTLLSLRHAAGSTRPYAILVPVWVASLASMALAILLTKGLDRCSGIRKK